MFQIKGHTRNTVDWEFANTKTLFGKSNIWFLDNYIYKVKKFSLTISGIMVKEVEFHDWTENFSHFFKKIEIF